MTNITKIHSKYYDLTDFDHPGGKTAIKHAYGRDATVLFESHHPFVDKIRLESILKKYRTDCKKDFIENDHSFNFNSDFARELKKRVKTYFEIESRLENVSFKKATKATFERKLFIAYLFILRLFGIYLHFSGFYLSIIIEPVLTWISGINTFHDACHFSLSTKPFINDLFSHSSPEFSQAFDWYHQHNIGHHAFTNMGHKDPDLYHAAALLRVHETVRHRDNHTYQGFMVPIVYLFAAFKLIFSNPYRMFKTGLYNRCVAIMKIKTMSFQDQFIYFIGKAYFLLCYIVCPFYLYSIEKAIIYIIVSRALYSAIFMFNSQITHLQTDCMKKSDDWYEHQIITACNHSLNSKITFILSGGLNYQIEHHLFPNVNHCHHPYIHKIVVSLCKKYDIEYKVFDGYWDAFLSYLKHIKKLSYK